MFRKVKSWISISKQKLTLSDQRLIFNYNSGTKRCHYNTQLLYNRSKLIFFEYGLQRLDVIDCRQNSKLVKFLTFKKEYIKLYLQFYFQNGKHLLLPFTLSLTSSSTFFGLVFSDSLKYFKIPVCPLWKRKYTIIETDTTHSKHSF